MLAEIGESGQRKLLESSALIVGLGGLGSPVAMYLAGAGVGRLGLADADTVSLTNLHRQLLYDADSVGCRKTDAARARLASVAPDSRFDLYPGGLTEASAGQIISEYNLVIDCCDNYATRYLIDDVCSELGKPWVFGSVSGFGGMASVFGCGCRYTDVFSDREELARRLPAAGGIIGPAAGVIGSIQAAEAVKILAGMKPTLDGRLLIADMLNMDFKIFDL